MISKTIQEMIITNLLYLSTIAHTEIYIDLSTYLYTTNIEDTYNIVSKIFAPSIYSNI